jgi:glycosyltransferase involved in cell wall biosynthesis
LVEALAPWRDLPWTLTIAGSTSRDADEARRLSAVIDRHDMAGRIVLAGEVDGAILSDLLHRSDLFVSASRYEGFGMALAEAIARGLPVVAVAGGAVAEWMDPQAAILMPPDRQDSLSGALGLVLRDPARRARLATGARAARERLPGWQDTARAADRLLREVPKR